MQRVQVRIDIFTSDRDRATTAGHMKHVCVISIATHISRDDATRFGTGTQDSRSGSIAKEDAGITILPVYNTAQLIGSDDKNSIVGVVRYKLVRNFDAVEEPGTSGIHIKTGRVFCSNQALDMACRGRKNRVWCDGPHQNQINLIHSDAGIFDGGFRGLGGHVACELVGTCDAPLKDPCTLNNPLMVGLHHDLKVGIGQNALGKVAASPNDGSGATRPRWYFAKSFFHGVVSSLPRCGY